MIQKLPYIGPVLYSELTLYEVPVRYTEYKTNWVARRLMDYAA